MAPKRLPAHPNQPYRTATPLELFVDLAFVVAVAQAAASLEHELLERHFQNGVLGFTLVFFAVWWAQRAHLVRARRTFVLAGVARPLVYSGTRPQRLGATRAVVLSRMRVATATRAHSAR